MKIKEFATGRGISVQAVYNRLKNAGIDTKQLMADTHGTLSDYGLSILDSLYNSEVQSTPFTLQDIDGLKIQITDLQEKVKALEKERDSFKQAAEVLQAKVTGMEQLVASVTDERDYLRANLTKSLDNFHTLIPADTQQEPERRSFWPFRRKK